MGIFLSILLYVVIGIIWMIIHSTYEVKGRPEGGPLYPIFMIFGWPFGIIIYGIQKIFKL